MKKILFAAPLVLLLFTTFVLADSSSTFSGNGKTAYVSGFGYLSNAFVTFQLSTIDGAWSRINIDGYNGKFLGKNRVNLAILFKANNDGFSGNGRVAFLSNGKLVRDIPCTVYYSIESNIGPKNAWISGQCGETWFYAPNIQGR